MNGLISLTFNGFPNGYCYPGNPDELGADLIAATTISFNASTGNLYYNFGPTVPSVDNRVYPWFRTGADYEEGWYYWDGTYWVSAHPVPASGSERRLWVGTLNELELYDGGDINAVTSTSGPFWEEDTDFAARSPIHPGTTAGGTIITVGANFGDDVAEVTIPDTALPAHFHYIGIEGAGSGSVSPATSSAYLRVGAGTEVTYISGVPPANAMGKTDATINAITAGQEALDVPTITPSRGAYVIKRTARVYRTVV